MKASLEREVKAYADTFAQWAEGFDRVHPLRAMIDIDSQNMLPRADEIIQRARLTAEEASTGLTAAQGTHARRNDRGRHRHGRDRPRLSAG